MRVKERERENFRKISYHIYTCKQKNYVMLHNINHFTQMTSNIGQHWYDLCHVLVPVVSCYQCL